MSAPLPSNPLHLQLRNDRKALDEIRLAVINYLAFAQPSAKAIYHAELVLEESLMNIIWHGFDDDATHLIDLYVTLENDVARFVFEDDGKPFDPTQARDAVPASSLEHATPGGFGLMLVRRFAKSVAYSRLKGRNHLTIEVGLR